LEEAEALYRSRRSKLLSTCGAQKHLDVNVLNQYVMLAVDCPSSPGITPDDLGSVICPLIAAPRYCGITISVFDHDLDPERAFAAKIVEIMTQLPFPDRRFSGG
jgi:arginase